MKFHILQHGFSPHYIIWKYHGENTTHSVIEDMPRSNEMADVIDDVMGSVIENDTNCNEGNLDTDGRGVDVGFQKLLEEVQFKLYPGCSFSSLDFLAKLMHIKVINKWTDSSFDQLLELLQTVFPEGNRVPPRVTLRSKKDT